MKTQYYAAASLDGFIAAEDDALDWLFQFGEPDSTSYPAFIREVGALAMGRATFDWILRHQIQPESGAPKPWPYAQPAWVFSSRPLPRLEGAVIHPARGDVRPVHEAMRAAAGGRNIWIVGGGELAGQFADAGLLDELIVQVTSVLLGRGKPLLPRHLVTPPLRLLSTQAYGTSFAELRYEIPRSA